MIDAALDAGVRRFVHLSSIAAYGWVFPDHVTEDYPARVTGGVSTYVDTKTNSEQVVFANAQRGMEMVVVRPADVYGLGSVWIREPLEIPADPARGRHRRVRRDLHRQLRGRCRAGVRSVPMRLGVPVLGVIGRVQRRLGMKSEVGPALLHMLNRRYVVSTAKAREVLGFQPTVSYREGMARSKEWARRERLI